MTTITPEGYERYHCSCGQEWETDDFNRNDDRNDRCPECGLIGKPGWPSDRGQPLVSMTSTQIKKQLYLCTELGNGLVEVRFKMPDNQTQTVRMPAPIAFSMNLFNRVGEFLPLSELKPPYRERSGSVHLWDGAAAWSELAR